MKTTEAFLAAMLVVFVLPFLLWRLGRTERWAPLVVVQIVTGILLGPGVLGVWAPAVHGALFPPQVIQLLGGLATWAVMLFVFVAGLELDLRDVWRSRRDSGITAGLALGVPLLFGALAALVLVSVSRGWVGPQAQGWQFVLGVGMSCAVTALPILILFMERLDLLRRPIGQRILRYASLDDIVIWGVLALILMDWARVGWQLAFLLVFAACARALRALMPRLTLGDRWAVALGWLLACALGAEWSGLHYMVGAFLAGTVLDRDWFGTEHVDRARHHVLLLMMPVFFLSTGLRTRWDLPDAQGVPVVFAAAALLLAAAVAGKLAGVHIAARLLRWPPGEARLVGWLLQTKALIMIIFANVLLDRGVITPAAFTALLLMALGSTMLTIPMVSRRLHPPAAGVATPHER